MTTDSLCNVCGCPIPLDSACSCALASGIRFGFRERMKGLGLVFEAIAHLAHREYADSIYKAQSAWCEKAERVVEAARELERQCDFSGSAANGSLRVALRDALEKLTGVAP